jgi:CRISPR-associated endonuclease/helicase Cas3
MLIEAVYGDEAVDIPEALRRQTLKALGEAMANESIAGFNAISLEQGYQEGLTGKWYDESRLSTRLSEEGRPIYLAREKDGVLRPLYDGEFAWEMSAVRVRTQLIDGLAPEWEQRFGTAIEVLRKCVPLLEGEALVLPLVPEGDGWSGMAKSRGRPIWVRYGSERGLDVQLPG